MSSFDIVALDPEERGPLFDGALALHHAEEAELDPERDPEPADSYRAGLRGTDAFSRRHLFATDAGAVVAGGFIERADLAVVTVDQDQEVVV